MTNYPYRDEEEVNPLDETSPLIEPGESATLGEVGDISRHVGEIPGDQFLSKANYRGITILIVVLVIVAAAIWHFL